MKSLTLPPLTKTTESEANGNGSNHSLNIYLFPGTRAIFRLRRWCDSWHMYTIVAKATPSQLALIVFKVEDFASDVVSEKLSSVFSFSEPVTA